MNEENLHGTGIIDDYQYQQEEMDEDLKHQKDLFKCYKLKHQEDKAKKITLEQERIWHGFNSVQQQIDHNAS